MKQMDNYFFNDDFEIKTETFFGVPIFCDGKHIRLDKQAILYDNAIGRACEKCGAFIKEKYYTTCDICIENSEKEKYSKLEIAQQTQYLYSDLLEEYFEKDSWDCIYNYLEELESYDEIMSLRFEDLRIHPCEEYFASTIQIENYFEEAPEDFDINSYAPIEEIHMHIDKVNELIKKYSIGYTPIMNKRIFISDEEWIELKKTVVEELQSYERT